MTTTQTVSVGLGERSYDIRVGPGLIENAGDEIKPLIRGNKVFVITDSTVSGHWLDPLKRSLRAAGITVRTIAVPPGESSKSFADFEHVCCRMLEDVVALGGGVVGDLAGYCAASVMRGLDFIQIPTTLLAQVDSSVGGKTGINTPQGKNLVGAFHQPRLVLADTGTLDTLPKREVRAGYAEVVKYGLIRDPAFFEWLEQHGAALIAGDEAARISAVVESCKAKAEVVAADEREAGLRELLNFGHTFGHALEAAAGFDGTLLHGEAVSIGMIQALELSRRLVWRISREPRDGMRRRCLPPCAGTRKRVTGRSGSCWREGSAVPLPATMSRRMMCAPCCRKTFRSRRASDGRRTPGTCGR